MIKGRKERKRRAEKAKDSAKMFSFKNGMQTLPRSLNKVLADKVQLNSSVVNIIPTKIGERRFFVTTYQQNGEKKSVETDAVVLAVPSYVASNIIEPIDPETSNVLNSIYYPPVAEIVLGYAKENINRVLDGFGYLIPAKEKRKILGTIWSSTIFPNRAPEGFESFTTFVGGSRSPGLLENGDENLLDISDSEVKSLVGISGSPVFKKIIRWEKAIPQYKLGYHKTISTIERFEQNFPGAFVCSNYRGGISVGDCVMSAEKTVKNILECLNKDLKQ
jgi:oxygen-dependent protoporphyrinogen oxidase